MNSYPTAIPFWKILDTYLLAKYGPEKPTAPPMPRHISELHDPLRESIQRTLDKMMQDPALRTIWRKGHAILQREFPWPTKSNDEDAYFSELNQHFEDFFSCIDMLVWLMPDRAPDVAEYYGPFLSENLILWLYTTLGLPAPPRITTRLPATVSKLYRLDPHSPITHDADDNISGFQSATPAQRMRELLYAKSRDATSPPGPPIGGSSQPPDFPDRVREAYEALLNTPDHRGRITFDDIVNRVRKGAKRTCENWLKESTKMSWKPFKQVLERWIKEAPNLTWAQFEASLKNPSSPR